jgi:ribosome-binding factor A
MGTPEEQKATMKGLSNAAGYLRHELATRIPLRYMPEFAFKLDTSIEEGSRVLELIRQATQEDEERRQAAVQTETQEEA